jgi:hypothetical protein
MTEMRRVAIAVGAFVVTAFVATLAGNWLFGSSNVLALYLAVIGGVAAYAYLRWRERAT